MAFDGSDPCWIPRVPISGGKSMRLREAQFGDGYKQRILDGINALETRWSLTFELLPEATLNAMDAYLAAQKGAAFVFQHPVTGTNYNVFCDEWQVDWQVRRRNPRNKVDPDYYGTLSAEFYVAYGVTVGALP